jgi:hypothetical protein
MAQILNYTIMKKSIRMLVGVISHPFKALISHLKGGASQYDGLKKKAVQREENKALYRSMYMASVTNTKI